MNGIMKIIHILLEKIQSLGQLIPGTETGFKAYSAYIEFGEIDNETLCSIIQSSCHRGLGCIGSQSDSKRQQWKQCSSPIGSGKKLDDIEYAMEFLPISLLEENNHEGLCPMDIIRERIIRRKKDD